MTFDQANLSRVKLHKNPNYKKNGMKSYVYLLQKFNIGPTQDGPFRMVTRLEQAGNQAILKKFRLHVGGRAHLQGHILAKVDGDGRIGEVPAEDIQHDSLYLAEVGIGTPAQKLMLDFDTGSSDLWCWSTRLPANVQAYGIKTHHTIFDPSQSSTWRDSPDETWQIMYGDGSKAHGDVGTDDLSVGGIVLHDQAIETAQYITSQFVRGSGDGLLGLAWGKINQVRPEPVDTPVENMISQNDIPQDAELFTAYLGSYKDQNDPDHGESFYTFGYIDQDVIHASGQDIHYTDVDNSQGFWQFESPTAKVGGKTINRSGNTAIADTGTTLALVDDDVCKAIYAEIPDAKYDKSQQGWIFPASTDLDDLPTVQFAVGSKLFTVQKEDLAFADAGNGMVYGGIQSRGDLGFDILGDTFLKGIYAIFDQGNKRFGCVQRVDPQ